MRLLCVVAVALAFSPSAKKPRSHADEPRRIFVETDAVRRSRTTFPLSGVPSLEPMFVPTVAQAKRIERALASEFATKHAGSPSDRKRTAKGYTFAYVGFTERGHEKIFARAQLDYDPSRDPSGVDLLFGTVLDGGCNVLRLIFDLETGAFDQLACNGEA